MKKLVLSILIITGVFSSAALADAGDYCDLKIRITNSTEDTVVRITEGWIFKSTRTLFPYENKTICMSFGRIHSPNFEYRDPLTGAFLPINGCPDDSNIYHSLTINIKDRKNDSSMPYCKFG